MSSPSLEPISFTETLFEFLRNTDLDAANYFAGNAGVFKQNQFGGTFGGPIKKDKVFFFGDYQGTKQILGQSQNFAVPSLPDRMGNLSDQASAFAPGTDANGNPSQVLSRGLIGPTNVLGPRLGYTVNLASRTTTPLAW